MCNIWIKEFAGTKLNTYGRAQKIVNMSFKYLYSYYYKNGALNQYNEKFSECHMTLDSYTLKWLKKNGANISCTEWSKIDSDTAYLAIIDEANKITMQTFALNMFLAEFIIWDYSLIDENINNIKKIFNRYADYPNDEILNIRDVFKDIQMPSIESFW